MNVAKIINRNMRIRKRLLNKYDVDGDGFVTMKDLNQVSAQLEIELREEKADTQRRMAWVAMLSMLIFTIGLFLPWVGDSRVNALSNLLGLFYIAQAGVVGAYMGVTAWMQNNRSQYSDYSSYNYQSQPYSRVGQDDVMTGSSKPSPNAPKAPPRYP